MNAELMEYKDIVGRPSNTKIGINSLECFGMEVFPEVYNPKEFYPFKLTNGKRGRLSSDFKETVYNQAIKNSIQIFFFINEYKNYFEVTGVEVEYFFKDITNSNIDIERYKSEITEDCLQKAEENTLLAYIKEIERKIVNTLAVSQKRKQIQDNFEKYKGIVTERVIPKDNITENLKKTGIDELSQELNIQYFVTDEEEKYPKLIIFFGNKKLLTERVCVYL